MCHPISLIKFEKMKKTLLIKKPSRSLLIESEEVSDTDECAPNTLNDLEINFSSGATKNIFESTKETISNESIFDIENMNSEKSGILSKQEYFIKNEVNLKFLKNVRGKSLNPDSYVFSKEEFEVPHIQIIKSDPIPKQKFNKPVEKLNKMNNKIFFSFENKSNLGKKTITQRKSNQIIPSNYFWKNHQYKMILFNPNATNEMFYNHLVMTYKGLKYAKECLKQPDLMNLQNKLVKLVPLKKKPRTLFFDLDNTLITHSYKLDSSERSINIFNEKGECVKIFINIRPYCMETLARLSVFYEIYIFTSATKEYADKVMDLLDPEKKIFSGALSRHNCFRTKKGFFIKDLRIIIDKYMTEMIIVDNLTHSFAFQIDNGIPILPWNNDPEDCELKHLTKYLIHISNFKDLRQANKLALRLSEMAKENLNEIINYF